MHRVFRPSLSPIRLAVVSFLAILLAACGDNLGERPTGRWDFDEHATSLKLGDEPARIMPGKFSPSVRIADDRIAFENVGSIPLGKVGDPVRASVAGLRGTLWTLEPADGSTPFKVLSLQLEGVDYIVLSADEPGKEGLYKRGAK